jgi:hypothetical protein
VSDFFLREVLRHLVLTEGWRGLSKGFSLNVIKGPIALSISLTTYDLLRGYLHTEDPEGGGGRPSNPAGSGSSSGGESVKRVRKVTDEFSRHRHLNMDENRMHCAIDNTETPSVPPVGGPKS